MLVDSLDSPVISVSTCGLIVVKHDVLLLYNRGENFFYDTIVGMFRESI